MAAYPQFYSTNADQELHTEDVLSVLEQLSALREDLTAYRMASW